MAKEGAASEGAGGDARRRGGGAAVRRQLGAAREVATSDAVTSPKPNPNLNPNELDAAREAATSDAVTKRLIHGPRLLGSAHPQPHPRPNPGDEAAHLAHGPAD